jgi:hypothetical protein
MYRFNFTTEEIVILEIILEAIKKNSSLTMDELVAIEIAIESDENNFKSIDRDLPFILRLQDKNYKILCDLISKIKNRK